MGELYNIFVPLGTSYACIKLITLLSPAKGGFGLFVSENSPPLYTWSFLLLDPIIPAHLYSLHLYTCFMTRLKNYLEEVLHRKYSRKKYKTHPMLPG